MELEHNHPLTFTEGHADFYRGCPPCEEMMRLLSEVARPRIDFQQRATYGPVTIPNLEREVSNVRESV